MKYVYDVMMLNDKFKDIINELSEVCIIALSKEQKEMSNEKKECLKQLLLTPLFSQNIFHIMHRCICQQIESETIDDDLIVEVRQNSIDLLTSNFDT